MVEYVDSSAGEVIDLDRPDGVAAALIAQQSRLERLTQRLGLVVAETEAIRDELEGRDDGGLVDGVTAWTWSALGPLGAEMLWQRLGPWVGWLRGRYPIAEQLPGCWWRHPELVEEITALHLAWRAAYSDPAASLTDPIDWHQHYLPAFLARIRGWGVHCTDTHRDRPAALYAEHGVDDPAAYAAYTAADVEARRTVAAANRPQPPPPPDPNAAEGGGPDDDPELVVLPAAEIAARLATGQGEPVGALPGAPALLDGEYWLADGARYVRVDDEQLEQQLRRDHQRLRAAKAASNGTPNDQSGEAPRGQAPGST